MTVEAEAGPMAGEFHQPLFFQGIHGNTIAADQRGEGGKVVLLAHGGGQTRHAWEKTARRLAARGLTAISIDHRGHGESDWDPEGRYDFMTFADDLEAVARQIIDRFEKPPIVVGASLGGISAMLSQGGTSTTLFAGIILVDITPRMEASGVSRVLEFMAAKMQHGFASVEEAADAVASYLPHRKRPSSSSGLRKNLRRHDDGRYRWHWDPKFVSGPRPVSHDHASLEGLLVAAVQTLTLPVMLVRGGRSELVSEAHARDFLTLVPHAEYQDVSGAGHMIVGDKNDVFADAVIGFIEKI